MLSWTVYNELSTIHRNFVDVCNAIINYQYISTSVTGIMIYWIKCLCVSVIGLAQNHILAIIKGFHNFAEHSISCSEQQQNIRIKLEIAAKVFATLHHNEKFLPHPHNIHVQFTWRNLPDFVRFWRRVSYSETLSGSGVAAWTQTVSVTERRDKWTGGTRRS